jgi:hypothetical protein
MLLWKSNEYYIAWTCVFVALGIQHAMRMRHIVICSLPRSTIFFHISHKRYDIRKTLLCVLILSTTFVGNIFHSKKNWSRYDQKFILIFMQSTLYSCPILTKLEFFRQIFEKTRKYQISWKSVQWEPSCSMQTDGRTDMTKLKVAFHKFAKAPERIFTNFLPVFQHIPFPFQNPLLPATLHYIKKRIAQEKSNSADFVVTN